MRFNRVHAVCAYLRPDGCKQCPSREKIGGYGSCIRGCRLKAEEVVNIVKYGYPWPPPYNARQKKWRSTYRTRRIEKISK